MMSSSFTHSSIYDPPSAVHGVPICCPPTATSSAMVGVPHASILPGAPFNNTSSHVAQSSFANSIPPPAPCFPGATSPTLSVTVDKQAQAAHWALLTAKFEETRLRRHNWAYKANNPNPIPLYDWCSLTKISDIWTEWSTGINGYLPVRLLEEGWGAKWRPGHAQGTERCRCMCVIRLVDRLAAKPGWGHDKTLRFSGETYNSYYTPRRFMDYVQKNGGAGAEQVFVTSRSYCT